MKLIKPKNKYPEGFESAAKNKEKNFEVLSTELNHSKISQENEENKNLEVLSTELNYSKILEGFFINHLYFATALLMFLQLTAAINGLQLQTYYESCQQSAFESNGNKKEY